MNRPVSVAIIAWILVALGGISIVTTSLMLNNPTVTDIMSKSPIPIPIQYVIAYFGMLVMIVSGIGMLKGFNWARFLYVIWSIIGLAISIATSPMKAGMIPGVVFFVVVVFFLFRPAANRYFTKSESSHDTQSV
jgi:hypothetical protein